MTNVSRDVSALHSFLEDSESHKEPDTVSPRKHPLWDLCVALLPILKPNAELTESNVETLIPSVEELHRNLDLHFKDDNKARVILYSALSTRYLALAGQCQEYPSTSLTYLKASITAHKASNQSAKDAENLNLHLCKPIREKTFTHED